jgi:prevent-host-death family protein
MASTVTVDQLQKDVRKYVQRAREKGPIRVSDNNGTAVVLLSIDDYKELSGQALHELLLQRFKEKPKYTNEEVRTMLKKRGRSQRRRA